jgi:hypothetical protein
MPEEIISWRSEERREWYAWGERAMDEVMWADTKALQCKVEKGVL